MSSSAPSEPVPSLRTLTLQQASAATGLSISTLRRHAVAGRLELVRVGGRTLVRATSLARLISGS